MKHTLASTFALKDKTAIVCPITGISMAVDIPSIGIDFNIYSPFVKFSNVQKILALPTAKIRELPSSVLAGILLATLHNYGLSESHEIEAWEANIYIQNCSKHEIISAIRFLSLLSPSKRESLPSLSIQSFTLTVEYSSASNIINTYIKTCRDIINPPLEKRDEMIEVIGTDKPLNSPSISSISSISSVSTISTTVKTDKRKKLSSTTRERIKILITEVSKDILATSKLVSYLRILSQKENIYTAAQETKEKIIAKLLTMDSPEASELADIIREATPSAIMQEDMDFSRASDTFAIVKQKKSLKEILAEKALKREAPTPESNILNSVIENNPLDDM